MICCLVCCCCCCCCLCCCFWARCSFWAENQEICERAGSCAEETKSIRRWPEKKKVDPISGVPWGSGWKGWLAGSRIYHRNHRNVTSITSKFVCWKCNETWCAMRRMIVLTVQTGGRSMSRVMTRKRGVCCRIGYFFSFGWKAAVLLSMRVCQWRLPTFNIVLSPKEMVLNMWFAMARTHFTYFVCQTNDGVVLVCQ